MLDWFLDEGLVTRKKLFIGRGPALGRWVGDMVRLVMVKVTEEKEVK